MVKNIMELYFKEEYQKIFNCCLNIKNNLGFGFLEKVYENALKIELDELGFNVKQQQLLTIKYKGYIIGDYIADLIVNDSIIIELKTIKEVTNIHRAQIINYLKATGLKLGIIINFNKDFNRFDIERIVY